MSANLYERMRRKSGGGEIASQKSYFFAETAKRFTTLSVAKDLSPCCRLLDGTSSGVIPLV
jgi:hypothetical protein